MSDFDLASLRAHPDLGEIEVLVDGGGVWREVEVAASVTDLLGGDQRAREGILAVVLAEPAAPAWRHDALVRRVAEAGYSALVLPSATVARDAGRLARRLGLTVVLAHSPLSVVRASWSLVAGRDALTLSYVRKVARTIEYVAEDLSDHLEHLHAGLGHAVALVDSDGTVTQVGPPLPEAVREQIGGGWVDVVRSPEGCAASVRVDSTSRPDLRLVFHGASLTEVQLQALSTAAEVAMPGVAARLLIDEVRHVTDVSRSSRLLGDLVDSGGHLDRALSHQVADRGWRLSGTHVGVRVVARTSVDPLALLQLALGEIGVAHVVHGALHDDGVSCWVPAPEGVDIGGSLRQAHRRMQLSIPVATGLGRPGRGAEGLVQSLHEASDAARLARSRPPSGWFTQFDALAPAQLLATWVHPDTFTAAARGALAPLDEEHLRTLAAYLDHESAASETAIWLGVHRNTVSVRVRRIEELLGVTLDDPDTRLSLHLACRAALG